MPARSTSISASSAPVPEHNATSQVGYHCSSSRWTSPARVLWQRKAEIKEGQRNVLVQTNTLSVCTTYSSSSPGAGGLETRSTWFATGDATRKTGEEIWESPKSTPPQLFKRTASKTSVSTAASTAPGSTMPGCERRTASFSFSSLERLLITLSLGDLMLEEEKVMAITKHKSVQQMRKDYGAVTILIALSASVVCPASHYYPSGYL